MLIGFKVAEKSGRPHPWDPENGMAGRAWYDGFMSRHPTLKLKSPQPLSHARARNADDETVKDFFQKLGGIYARLNLLNKPMQIYNLDESGISTVHKPGHVISELNHKSVWAVNYFWREREDSHYHDLCFSIWTSTPSHDDFSKETFE
jgi:hypothetical protein